MCQRGILYIWHGGPDDASVHLRQDEWRGHSSFAISFSKKKNDTCVFILSTPGTGSSSMVKMLLNAGCEVSGENWGALISLRKFKAQMEDTERQPRKGEHEKFAWRKVFDYHQVEAAHTELVRRILNPRSAGCWGFKEIRYGRVKNMKTLAADIAYLKGLCAHPTIVFHYRADFAVEANSSMLQRFGKTYQADSWKQRQCFDAYLKGPRYSAPQNLTGCACVKGCDDPPAFLHTLEDYIQNTSRHVALFQHLGLNMMSAADDIHLR